MADLKTTNIYGDAYINNKVGIATNAPATRLQIGQLSPTASTEGIQFGDDTGARLHRINTGHIRATGGFSSATYVIADNYLQTNNNLIYPAGFSSTQRLEVGNAAQNAWITGISIAPGGIVTLAPTSSLFVNGPVQIMDEDPTITLRDTNHSSSFIHVNANTFHILGGPPNAAFGEWAIAANGRWPLEINLTNNNATFGGNVDAISFSGAGTGLTGTATSLTAGTATSANALNASNNYQVNSIGIGMAGSGTAGKLSLNQAGVRSWSITPSGGRLVIEAGDGLGSAIFSCPVTSSNFVGPGTGLTGTAAGLSVGGTAGSLSSMNISQFTNNSNYQYHRGDITSLSGSATNLVQPLGTFDGANITGSPTLGAWYNYLSSTHNNYLTSLIANEHRTANWYVAYRESTLGTPTNPSWYKLLHSGNYTDYPSTANAISFTEVELNAPATTGGTWTTGNGSQWGEPKFGTSFNQFRYADGDGPYVEYNVPANHHACFISQLQWDTGGYADCHGVQSDGDLVFLRRINTRQLVENSDHGNTIQHDGATVSFVGSGLGSFTKIRITNRGGRIHMTGIAFTRQIDDGYEGTGMVHPAQISHQGAGSGLNADLLDGYNPATANTTNTIVLRDGSGNFSAGTITATLSGTATTATTANALNTSNSYTGVNFTATGFLQTNAGSIKTDAAPGLAILTTTDTAQSIRTKGILLGTSYDTTPGANEIRTTNNTSLYLNARGTGDIQFQTADSLKMMLLNNGNVGIGVSSPTSKLHVVETTATGSRIQLGSTSTNALMNTNLVNDFLILTAPFNAVPASTSNNNAKWGIKMSGGSVDSPNAREKSACIYAVSEEDIGAGGSGAGYNRKVGLALHTSPFDLPSVERVRINNLGNVGIGTTSPSGKLDVYNGEGRNLNYGTTGLLRVQRNVAALDGGTPVLQLINTQGMDGGTGLGTGIQIDLGYGGFTNDTVGTAARGARISAINDTIYTSTAATQNASLALYTSTAGTLTEKMRISSTGDVGIGTTVTAARLHISSTTAGATLLRTDGTNGTLFSVVDDLSDSLMSVNNSAGLPVLEVFADDRIVAGQYGQNDFVIINNKVGIGTNNPIAKLQVTSSASIPSALFMGGNVGIGTTNPVYRFQVSGQTYLNNGTDNAILIQTNVADNTIRDGIVLYEDSSAATGKHSISWYNGNQSYFKARLWTEVGAGYLATQFGIDVADDARAVATRLLIRNGNVGIGTTLPRALLHVNGVISGSSFTGAGTGLTGTAASLTAGAANSVAWTNVSGRPTAVSSFTNDSGYLTSVGTIATASYANALNPANNYIVNSLTEGGYLAYPLREYVINLSGQSATNFYPVAINNPPGTDSTWHNQFSVDMTSQGGGEAYNMHSMYGEVRGQGWSDQNRFYRVFHNFYESAERSILGIWRGTQDFYGVIVYLRGGKNYYVRTTSRSVVGYNAVQTLGNAVFAIKNAAGADVSGTSANIAEMLNLINNPSGFYHNDNAYIGTNQVVHLGTTSAPNLSIGGSAASAATATSASFATTAATATNVTIADGSITTAKLATDSVTASKLPDGVITTVKITDANVTAAKLATDAVTTVKIADANVTAAKLASDAVTTVKIANSNVTLAKIENISTGRILGNNGASAAAPLALTSQQVAAMLSGQPMNIDGNCTGTAASLIAANSYTVGNLTVNSMAQLVGVKETYVDVNIASGVVTIDLNAGTVFRLNYNATVNSFTINNRTNNKVNSFTLISVAAAGAGGINFTFTANTLKWAGATAPTATVTAGKFDVFSFIFDGTNWYGFVGGLNY